MKLKQDQAGFSLLEVILSVAILAIISIPLLSYFSESMKYNSKMAQKQHATTLAQEVLESLKNEDELMQDPGPGYTIPFLTNQGYVLDPATDTLDAKGMGKADFYGDAGAIGKDYDVVIHVNTATTESAKKIPQILASDDTKDVLAMESGQKQEALAAFKSMNATASEQLGVAELSTAEIEARMTRELLVTIAQDGVYQKAVVDCTYWCKDLKGTGSNDKYECTPYAQERLSTVRRVYLLYYVGDNDDTLELNVGTGITAPELMIICQNTSALTNAYSMSIAATTMPEISANIGKDGRSGSLINKNTGFAIPDVKSIVEDENGVRKIDLTVSVYAKGESRTAGAEPYITVDAAKGE